MAAAAGLHFNLAASFGSAPLTPFGAFGSPFGPFAPRFNGVGAPNARPNGATTGGKPPTFELSLAETLGHHHHAAAMAAAAAAAELAAYHHAHQQHQAPVTTPVEPLKIKSDLKSSSGRSSASSRHSARSSPPPTPPTPPKSDVTPEATPS